MNNSEEMIDLDIREGIKAVDKNGDTYVALALSTVKEGFLTKFEIEINKIVDGDKYVKVYEVTRGGFNWEWEVNNALCEYLFKEDKAFDGVYAYIEDRSDSTDIPTRFISSKENIIDVKYIETEYLDKKYSMNIQYNNVIFVSTYDDKTQKNHVFDSLVVINYGKVFHTYEEGKKYIIDCYDEMKDLFKENSEYLLKKSKEMIKDADLVDNLEQEFLNYN